MAALARVPLRPRNGELMFSVPREAGGISRRDSLPGFLLLALQALLFHF
jgi:hypothetical protein